MRVLAINDMSGFGRVALTTAISVINASGNQCIPLPTSVFSTHAGYKDYVLTDLTSHLEKTLEHYTTLNIDLNWIYSGFLNKIDQIELVKQYAQTSSKAKILVDPIMGDNGKMYGTFTKETCNKMIELASISNILTPNITEAKILVGKEPDEAVSCTDDVNIIAKKLQKLCPKAVIIITGIEIYENKITSMIYDKNEIYVHEINKISGYFPGTGDLFASVLLSQILQNKSINDSVNFACKFVEESIKTTIKLEKTPLEGVVYEPILYKLKN